MKVHVLTHTIIDAEPKEIYSLVGEHLDRQNEMGTVTAVAIQHGGEIPVSTTEADRAGYPHFLYLGEDGSGEYSLEHTDDIVDVFEATNLAAEAIAVAQRLGNKS